MAFYKDILEKHKFDNNNIGEANTIIKNNIYNFHEISWENIIVSMVHKYNTTNRITPDTKSEGNFYKFSKGLFKYLLELQNK